MEQNMEQNPFYQDTGQNMFSTDYTGVSTPFQDNQNLFDESILNMQNVQIPAQNIVYAQEIQELEESKSKLEKQLFRERILLVVLSFVTIIVFIARFVI